MCLSENNQMSSMTSKYSSINTQLLPGVGWEQLSLALVEMHDILGLSATARIPVTDEDRDDDDDDDDDDDEDDNADEVEGAGEHMTATTTRL